MNARNVKNRVIAWDDTNESIQKLSSFSKLSKKEIYEY